MDKHITLLGGTANPELAEKVSKHLRVKLTPVDVKKFNDGETYVKIQKSVRGNHVFVIQPTCNPANDNLMELLQIVDALKRGSAKEITAILPYYGYGRQDRKATSREPITARLVATLLEAAGVHRVVTFDMHVDQIQGFFNIPVDNLLAMPIIAQAIKANKAKDVVIVSPDVGSATRARRMGKLFNAQIAIIDKRRPRHGVAKVMRLIGDVKDKTAIIVDDMIDTGGTIVNAAKKVMENGAKEVILAATHPVFSKECVDKLKDEAIKSVYVTDTIKIPEEKMLDKFEVVSLAPYLAELIHTIYEGKPMGIIVNGKFDKAKVK